MKRKIGYPSNLPKKIKSNTRFNRYNSLWITLSVFLFCVAAIHANSTVEIIVESELYESGLITAKLERYINDIRAQGYNPILTTSDFSDAASLRAHLTAQYNNGLSGTVFIGDLPIVRYERKSEKFACDLYFQDLDGIWEDDDNDGYFDKHSGNVVPEIWMGRLLTSKLVSLHDGRSEAGLINDYFDKNHAYRTGALSITQRGLLYVDDDWTSSAITHPYYILKSIPGGSTKIDKFIDGKWVSDTFDLTKMDIVSDKSLTTTDHYKHQLRENEYESIFLAAHSTATSHSMGTQLRSRDLKSFDPQCFFYMLYCCSNANYDKNGYMTGEYVFGTTKGLIAISSTKTGGILTAGVKTFYPALGEGKTYGEAMRTMFRSFEAGWNDATVFNYYGLTLIGDPLLMTQEFRSKTKVHSFDIVRAQTIKEKEDIHFRFIKVIGASFGSTQLTTSQMFFLDGRKAGVRRDRNMHKIATGVYVHIPDYCR